MKDINKIYSISSGSESNLDLPDRKDINDSLKKYKNELFRDSMRREKIFLPFFLRRLNLLWEVPVILLLCLSSACVGINAYKDKAISSQPTDAAADIEEEPPVIADTQASLIVNGEIVQAKEETVTIDNRTYIKLPLLCSKLQYELELEQADENSVVINMDNKSYYVSADSEIVKIKSLGSGNDVGSIVLSQKVLLYNDELYIYVRDLSLFMPISTIWDENTKTIDVRSIQ